VKATPLVLFFSIAFAAVPAVRAQDDNPKNEDNLRTQTRSAHCSIGVQFGLRIVPPSEAVKLGSTSFETVFAGLRNGITVPSNGRIELGFKNLSVSPLPGTISFKFFRGVAGDEAVATTRSYDFQLADDAALNQFNHPGPGKGISPPSLDAPASLDPQHKEAAERIRIVAIYTPKNSDESCSATDSVVVQWTWNGKPDEGSAWPFQQPNPAHPIPKSRSRVDTSDGIIDEITGFPGQINKATQTVVLFAVDDAFGCCGQPQHDYAIVQFVRHTWKLGSGKEQSDDWNLDGPESQSTLHDQGKDYDPTYTNKPGTSSNGLVQAGPWDGRGSSPAITVYDFPGLLEPQDKKFAEEGGWISWEFVTLLVCKENPPTQKQYLDFAMVQAMTRYRITRTYTKGGATPQVEISYPTGQPVGTPKFYKPKCEKLKDLLKKFQLQHAFENPRSHKIKLQ
jgi:hypothetical protein